MRPMKTIAAAIAAFLLLAPSALAQIQGTTGIQSGSAGSLSSLTINGNTILTGPAAATLQLGAADAAAPVAQTIGVQSVVAGTSNTAGVTTTHNNSAGTGTGLGGNVVWNYAPHGSTGTAQNAFVTAMTLDGDAGSLTLNGAATGAVYLQLGAGTNSYNGSVAVGGTTSATAAVFLYRGSDNASVELPAALGMGWSSTTNPTAAADISFWRSAAGIAQVSNAGSTNSNGSMKFASYIAGGTAPTPTGTCTRGTQTGGLTAGSIVLTCTAQTLILTFTTTAPTGWMCEAIDQTTTADTMKQTSNTTTSCTLTGTTAASDVVIYQARAY